MTSKETIVIILKIMNIDGGLVSSPWCARERD
ncbi:hypothetical protein ACUXCC_001890 [Cytobacillus horneckiae]